MTFPDITAYGELVYSLPERYPVIQRSTLVLATIGPWLTKVEGQVTFESDVVLDVWELIDFDTRRIRNYGAPGRGAGWGGAAVSPALLQVGST